jgi:hypothetical protein
MKCSITKPDRRPRVVRNALRAIIVGLFVFLIVGVAWFSYLRFCIDRLDRAFSAVHVGDDSSRVTELMGSPNFVRRGNEMIFLSLLSEDERDQCTEQYTYTDQTFFVPIIWLVFFDDNDRVIMKWRLD